MRVFKVDKQELIAEAIGGAFFVILVTVVSNYLFQVGWIVFFSASAFYTLIIVISSKNKVIIDDEGNLILMTAFSKRSYELKAYKGFRITKGFFVIEPYDAKLRSILIDYVGTGDEFMQWLYSNFINLDKLEAKEIVDEEKIAYDKYITDPTYGDSIEQRKNRLFKANLMVIILNCLSIIGFVWIAVMGVGPEYSIPFLIAVPFISIIILKLSKGLIRINTAFNPVFPTIFWATLISSIGLNVNLQKNYIVYDSDLIWQPLIIGTLCILAFILIKNQEFKIKSVWNLVSWIVVTVLIGFYVYVVIGTINCAYDQSKFHTISYTIQKRVVERGGKGETYFHFILEESKERPLIKKIHPSYYAFTNKRKGDTLNLSFKRGYLNLKWYKPIDLN